MTTKKTNIATPTISDTQVHVTIAFLAPCFPAYFAPTTAKMIDGSILAIANAIAATQTKGDYYNGYGTKERQEGMTISAIIEDA